MALSPARSLLCAGILLSLAACSVEDVNPAPERATAQAPVPVASSRLFVPIDIPLAELQQLLNREVPQTLFSIDRAQKACVPAQRITVCLKHEQPCEGAECRDVPCKIGVKKRAITPALDCRITGSAERGPIRLSGSGRELRFDMPLSARIEARDIGKIISRTATAAADVHGRVRLDLGDDWRPTAKLQLSYDWQQKPGTEFAGRRFTFAHQTDRALRPVIADLERDIPRYLDELGLRDQLAAVWQQAFTVIEVNQRNPTVWMRVTPRQLGYGGYRITDSSLRVLLQLEAGVETFVGEARPADPVPIPLPASHMVEGQPGFHITAPVIADYATLQPVLQKALAKLAAKPVMVPAVGAVRVKFGPPRIYATPGKRLAIGLPIEARSRRFGWPTRGLVWLTGAPVNAANSPILEVHDLKITGTTNRRAADLLLRIALSPDVVDSIETGLRQDLSRDLESLRGKIARAIRQRQLGDFQLQVVLDDMQFGTIEARARGAWLPVEISGRAR